MDSRCAAIVSRFCSGKRPVDAAKLLKAPQSTVYDAITCFKEQDKASSERPPAITARVRKIIQSRVQRNPRVSMRKFRQGAIVGVQFENRGEKHNDSKRTIL
uniref:Paired domain-containing protein n=1 Tax=Plectus sambesii TaxID=2011161 RepID=A0A914VUR4_9BILA